MNDETILAAYRNMVLTNGCSADDILVTPILRENFVQQVISRRKGLTEKFVLQRLIYLRKKGRLPRSRELIAG